jgi:3-methylfumaryl-CoA hydratase
MISFEDVNVGDALPERSFTASNVSLFLYNAIIWNAHRIHYDEPYTREVEHHAAIVIDGPLQGDWLSQTALNWVGDAADLVNFRYRNSTAAYLGETLTTGGTVVEVDRSARQVRIELFVKNRKGETITPGEATLRFS